MTSKLPTLSTISNLASSTTAETAINSNFTRIAASFENTLSLDGSTPNAMKDDFDVGGYRIINLGAPIDPNDAVRYSDFLQISTALTPEFITTIEGVEALATQAAADAAAAAQSAADAASYIGAPISAPKWTTARTITLTGDVTGSQSFDGSANFSVVASLASGSVTGTKLASSAVSDSLGYTPASTLGATFIGDVKLNFNPVTLDEFSIGFRGVPVRNVNSNITLSLDYSAFMLRGTDAVDRIYYVPLNSTVAFPIGTVILIRVTGTGRTSIIPGDPTVSIRLSGSSVVGNKRVNQWGYASLTKEDTDTWVISGTGVEIL